ncbi:hypothetical protein FPOA_03788 [Fusarium poae]|uniref:DUF7587 domain-containing protein n=1 Tax=Fusarium poae TaxID=36050 RepID=A0A1B8ARS6_FUSPO|nr:hypothetical protein FPOA_03788 [Fusarium poae]
MASVEDIHRQVAALSLTESSTEEKQSQVLGAALQELDSTSKLLMGQLDTINKLISSNTEVIAKHEAAFYQAYQRVRQSRLKTQRFQNAAVQSVVTRITSLVTGRHSQTTDMLAYFDRTIKDIIKNSLPDLHDKDSLWIIIEKCYIQAVTPSGQLHANNYVDFLSQRENEKNHVADFEDTWVHFWATCLNNCPGGPTLFIPPAITPFQDENDPPKYLFRAYDEESWGTNREDIIASSGCDLNRRDILSRSRQDASSKMLYGHLRTPYGSTRDDNLVSWSSSLLFVIQCANYRSRRAGMGSDGVFICAVDTTKFPKGQFARDKWLMTIFRDVSGEDAKFRILRFEEPTYDNGEYLSQGTLNVKGRSCLMSLRNLQRAGLGRLYPELDVERARPTDPVRRKWTNYVKDLREAWQNAQASTDSELQSAIEIAESCFESFDEYDMTLLLLAFRERKLKNTDGWRLEIPGPAEVCRYMNLSYQASRLEDITAEGGLEGLRRLFKYEWDMD